MGKTPRGHVHHPLPVLCVPSSDAAELRPRRPGGEGEGEKDRKSSLEREKESVRGGIAALELAEVVLIHLPLSQRELDQIKSPRLRSPPLFPVPSSSSSLPLPPSCPPSLPPPLLLPLPDNDTRRRSGSETEAPRNPLELGEREVPKQGV